MPAIEVSHVTKEYQLGALQSLKQKLVHTGARLMGRAVEPTPLFKALDDVNFSIEPGEVVGIIGHNGAGKSTLLKMLANISTPTSGHVKVNGRVAPLIEVGAGFVGDFTGRENVYLNGAILGMSKREIDRKFDEIIDFAEMAEFIDTPVKRYSSGMQVKLAFAVATSIEAEILIVDEVLAVGDLAFQRKCFDRMEDLIKRQSRTVLLVSHNIRQVQRLCKRVLMMDHGMLHADGLANEVCNLFYEQTDSKIQARTVSISRAAKSHSSGDIELQEVHLTDVHGHALTKVDEGQAVNIVLHFRVVRTLQRPIFAAGLHTADLLYLAVNRSEKQIQLAEALPGDYRITCHIGKFPLLAGVYSIRASVAAGVPRIEHYYGENLISFQVVSRDPNRGDLVNEGFLPMSAEWHVSLPVPTQAANNPFATAPNETT